MEYFRKGKKVIASLLLGYYIENQLKAFTKLTLGYTSPALSDCMKVMESANLLSQYKKGLFQRLLGLRNKFIHQQVAVSHKDFNAATKNLELLEDALQ